jgi:hypothetical protein
VFSRIAKKLMSNKELVNQVVWDTATGVILKSVGVLARYADKTLIEDKYGIDMSDPKNRGMVDWSNLGVIGGWTLSSRLLLGLAGVSKNGPVSLGVNLVSYAIAEVASRTFLVKKRLAEREKLGAPSTHTSFAGDSFTKTSTCRYSNPAQSISTFQCLHQHGDGSANDGAGKTARS